MFFLLQNSGIKSMMKIFDSQSLLFVYAFGVSGSNPIADHAYTKQIIIWSRFIEIFLLPVRCASSQIYFSLNFLSFPRSARLLVFLTNFIIWINIGWAQLSNLQKRMISGNLEIFNYEQVLVNCDVLAQLYLRSKNKLLFTPLFSV